MSRCQCELRVGFLLGALAGIGLLGALVIAGSDAEAGKGLGEDSSYTREMGFESQFFYGTSGGANNQVEYICRAYPGTTGSDSTASSVWQVQRFTYNASGQVTAIEFAGDDDAFTNVCDNRVSLDYD